MALFAHVKDGQIYRYVELAPAQYGRLRPVKKAYILPVQEMPAPVYDPELQTAPVKTVTILAQKVVHGWTAPVDLTPVEIDARKEARLGKVGQVNSVDRAIGEVLRIVYNQAMGTTLNRRQFLDLLKSKM